MVFPKNLYVNSTHVVRFKEHLDQWQNCKVCPLYTNARNHVLYRGHIPCEILFIGEAPGESEDVLGEPFVGPSGSFLNHILVDIRHEIAERNKNEFKLPIARLNPNFRIGITNTVACAPWQTKKLTTGQKVRTTLRSPHLVEVASCSPRVINLVKISEPKGVVLLGSIAKSNYANCHRNLLNLPHPAYILRRGLNDRNKLEENFRSSLYDFITICLME